MMNACGWVLLCCLRCARPCALVVATLVLSSGFMSCTSAPSVAPGEAPPVGVAGPLGARVDDFLTRLSGFGDSGNALVSERGVVGLEKGYGLADRARGTAYTPDTIFDIGSRAKQFTAAAVLKLEGAGR